MKKQTVATPKWDENRNYWKLNVQKDGQRKSFYCSTPGRAGKAEVLQKANAWLQSAADGDPKFSDAFDAYMKHKQKIVGVARYTNLCSMFKQRLEGCRVTAKKLSRISTADWQQVLDKASDDGMSAAYINEVRSNIVSFINFCQQNRWSIEPIVGKLDVHSKQEKKEKQILQPEHLKILFSNDVKHTARGDFKEWYINLYRFAVIVGMRRGELLGLKWEDIENDTLSIKRSRGIYEMTTGKNNNARRTFKLSDSALNILSDQKKMLQESHIVSPWVFPNPKGEASSPGYVYRAWKVFCKYNGLPDNVCFHGLRHTMISINQCVMPEQMLKRVVGHSNTMDTFGVYGHEVSGESDTAAEIIDTNIKRILG